MTSTSTVGDSVVPSRLTARIMVGSPGCCLEASPVVVVAVEDGVVDPTSAHHEKCDSILYGEAMCRRCRRAGLLMSCDVQVSFDDDDDDRK